jgi:hypothetical protein
MVESVVAYTSAADAKKAAAELAARVMDSLRGQPPDALIVFASPVQDHATLLEELRSACRARVIVGASSAGEFTSAARSQGSACALALRSSEIQFNAAIGRGLAKNPSGAARDIAASFQGLTGGAGFPYRTALVFTDALAGHAEALVDELTLATSGKYQFVGGGAGDNAEFQRTPVFHNTDVVTDAAVALEILSKKPIGIGVGHGWEPASAAMRVTEAVGARIVSLNSMPARELFVKHAESTGQRLDLNAPIPFFLHNILGIDTGTGYRLRVPLQIFPDGSIGCAAEIPKGAVVHIMKSTAASAADAAARAAGAAVEALDGNPAKVALFFDCVATRLRLGDAFGFELESLAKDLGTASFVGCNTHGQIARAEGQFGGFHNCTAVVCAFPE